MKFIKKILILNLFLVGSLFAEMGIVDTNVLLIKKEPSEASVKFGFYKKNESIDVLGEVEGIDNEDRWFRTKKGYVKADYVILEKYLPQFMDEKEVDFNKNALQLIVYQTSVVQGLKELRKKLKNEKNLYKRRSKNVNVIYLVNFDSYSSALEKKKELAKLFPTSFITKIKAKSTRNNIAKVEKNIESIKPKVNLYEEESAVPLEIEDLSSEDISIEEIEKLSNIENREDILIEDPVIKEYESKPINVQRKERKVVTHIPKPKTPKKTEVKKVNLEPKVVYIKEKENHSISSLMENILIKLNE